MKSKQNFKNIILYLLPALLLYSIFELYPMIQAVFLSFYKWNGIGGANLKFVGFNNFISIFQDKVFWMSIKNLGIFLVLGIVSVITISFFLAYLLSLELKGTKFFKVTFFLPVVLSVTAVSLMWKMILDNNYGLLNTLLTNIGLGNLARAWLTDPSVCFIVIVLINSWIFIGYYTIIMLAQIISIPKEIFESLNMDGAGEFTTIFKAVLPLSWDVIGICIVLVTANIMKAFDLVYVLTSGSFGPSDINQIPVGLIYYKSFISDQFGQGSALSTIVMILGISLSAVMYFKIFQKADNN